MKPKISVLVAARRDSKYLAKFLHGYFDRTDDTDNTEILVMMNQHDTWNEELVRQYDGRVRFFKEDLRLGRSGLHVYFNELLKHATGEWIVYFCEDHFIIYDGWDNRLRSEIIKRGLKANEVNVIVPVFDNAGAMNHIVSRGWVDTIGDLGKHGWIDSYINGVLLRTFMERPSDHLIKNIDDPLFHDFTHDQPNPMDAGANQSPVGEDGKKLPKFDTDEVQELVERDAIKIKQALEAGR